MRRCCLWHCKLIVQRPFVASLKPCRPSTTDNLILSCLSQGDIMAYSRACRQLNKTVSGYNQRAYRIELVLGAIWTQMVLKFQIDNSRTILYLRRNHRFSEVAGNNRRNNFGIDCSTIFRPWRLCKLRSWCICGTSDCSTSGTMAWANRLCVRIPSRHRVSNPGNGSRYKLWFQAGGPDDWTDRRSRERLFWCGSHSGLPESKPPQHPTHHISGATAWTCAQFPFE